MDFNRHALADLVFVDAGTERDDRSHIFVAGRKVLVERFAALDQSRRAVIDDLKVGGADRYGVDTHQDFGALGHRNRLLRELKLAGIAENPGLHRVGDREILARFHTAQRGAFTSPVGTWNAPKCIAHSITSPSSMPSARLAEAWVQSSSVT